MPTDPIETTEYFTTETTVGLTVSARFMRMSDRFIFDSDDATWKENARRCTTPDHPAAELTDLSDNVNSEYVVSVNLAEFNLDLKPQQFTVQFRSGTILATEEFLVVSGRRADVPRTITG